jgi:hypothetical protein
MPIISSLALNVLGQNVTLPIKTLSNSFMKPEYLVHNNVQLNNNLGIWTISRLLSRYVTLGALIKGQMHFHTADMAGANTWKDKLARRPSSNSQGYEAHAKTDHRWHAKSKGQQASHFNTPDLAQSNTCTAKHCIYMYGSIRFIYLLKTVITDDM